MSFGYYMTKDVMKFYYQQINAPDSLENAADSFWLNLLNRYFTVELDFGIEREACVLGGTIKYHARTIRYFGNVITKKVVLIGDKSEKKEGSWQGASQQLTRYLKLVRSEKGQDKTQTLYGAVYFSTYVRFYQLDPFAEECIDLPMTGGAVCELAADEEQIHNVLIWLVQATAQ